MCVRLLCVHLSFIPFSVLTSLNSFFQHPVTLIKATKIFRYDGWVGKEIVHGMR